jgi:hypothetical protein
MERILSRTVMPHCNPRRGEEAARFRRYSRGRGHPKPVTQSAPFSNRSLWLMMLLRQLPLRWALYSRSPEAEVQPCSTST